MPKVIHVLRKFQPHEWGGIETHLVGLLPELARLGWESEVHAPLEAGTDGGPIERVGAAFRTFRASYPYARMGPAERSALVASSGNLVSTDELGRLLSDRSASLLHAHTLRRLGGVVRTASRLRAIPYAVTIHGPVRAGGDVVERDLGLRTRHLVDLGAPFGWLVGARRVVHDADLVFALNRRERDAWAGDREGRHLAHASLGVDPTKASAEARREARSLIPGGSHAKLIVVLARMEAAKGQDLALEAFLAALPPGCSLVLAGAPVSPAFAAEVRARAAASGRPVHVLGNVPPRLARALLAEAELVLVPSRAETFGIVLLEAWAEGAPTLFANVGGLADIARASGVSFGVVDDPSPRAFAAAIASALASPDLLARERLAGPERVARQFTWRALAEQTAAAYARATRSQPL